MIRLTFLLISATQVVCHAQLCESSSEVRDALEEARKHSAGSAAPSSATRAVLEEFPEDLWAHRAYQDTFKWGHVYRQAVIEEYKALLGKHSESPEYLYLYGRTLMGTKTPDAIVSFDQALVKDPGYAPVHLALAEIYRTPNFKDPDKAQRHLEAWMNACPGPLEGFRLLERMEASEFVRRQVARMRVVIEHRTDAIALGQYHLLWTLEFQTHPAPEYAQVKEKIRGDLTRLRELDPTGKPSLAFTLREGFKLVDDKEGLKWVDEKFPGASANSAAQRAYDEWQKVHPMPVSKAGEKFDDKAYRDRNKAFLDVTAEWIAKWPGNNFLWKERLTALQMNRETPDSEVERVAEGLRRSLPPGAGMGAYYTFQLARMYLDRNMHLNEVPDMVQKALEKLDKEPGAMVVSDMYPAPPGAGGPEFENQMTGYSTLIDAYLKTDHPDQALAALADMRRSLDENKVPDSAPDFAKRNWAGYESDYWRKMGQIAEKQGRKLDALTYYQNEAQNSPFQANRNLLARKAKVLWTDLGGTDSAWSAWLARIEPARPAVAPAPRAEWEDMNKPLPPFELADMSGKTWRLTDIKGKNTLINIWATWCGPCRMELPQLQKLYDKLKDRPDIQIITLNTDDNPGLIEGFLKENKYTFPVVPARAYVDTIIPSLSIPRNWIVNKEAILKLEAIGFGRDSDKWIDRMTEKIEKVK